MPKGCGGSCVCCLIGWHLLGCFMPGRRDTSVQGVASCDLPTRHLQGCMHGFPESSGIGGASSGKDSSPCLLFCRFACLCAVLRTRHSVLPASCCCPLVAPATCPQVSQVVGRGFASLFNSYCGLPSSLEVSGSTAGTSTQARAWLISMCVYEHRVSVCILSVDASQCVRQVVSCITALHFTQDFYHIHLHTAGPAPSGNLANHTHTLLTHFPASHSPHSSLLAHRSNATSWLWLWGLRAWRPSGPS